MHDTSHNEQPSQPTLMELSTTTKTLVICTLFSYPTKTKQKPTPKHYTKGWLPGFTLDGKIILEGPTSVFKAPDGNGGIYVALEQAGVLQHMRAHGVEAVDCFGVDNVLVRPGDPLFSGYCWQKQAQCGMLFLFCNAGGFQPCCCWRWLSALLIWPALAYAFECVSSCTNTYMYHSAPLPVYHPAPCVSTCTM